MRVSSINVLLDQSEKWPPICRKQGCFKANPPGRAYCCPEHWSQSQLTRIERVKLNEKRDQRKHETRQQRLNRAQEKADLKSELSPQKESRPNYGSSGVPLRMYGGRKSR